MATQLHITWDGETPGLSKGRLSLVEFGPALNALMKATRNIAATHAAARVGEKLDLDKGTKRTIVDLQLSEYRSGSANVAFDVVPVPSRHSSPLFMNALTEGVVRDLVECIRDESQGKRRNRWVNEYLHTLPKELGRQRYSVLHDGVETNSVEFGAMTLAEPVADVPKLWKVSGMVAGVVFGEPLRYEVTFAPFEGQVLRLAATKELVDEAVALRGQATDAMTLTGDSPRLLWIRAAIGREQAPRMTPEEREDHIFRKWEELLRRLSE